MLLSACALAGCEESLCVGWRCLVALLGQPTKLNKSERDIYNNMRVFARSQQPLRCLACPVLSCPVLLHPCGSERGALAG